MHVAEPVYLGNERRYVADAIDRRLLSGREYVPRFEQAFAEWIGVPHAVAVHSGTAALHLALLALGVGPGDEVVVPALTYVATANAVLYCGATPVVVDVRPDTWTIDWAAARRARGPRTKAVVPVHLYGVPAGVLDARMTGVSIVEDAAEAHGAAERPEGRVGSYGAAGAFSFYANKILACGEGGMVTTRFAEVAARARHLRGVCQVPGTRYAHDALGFNARLTDPAAALGLAQLERAAEHLDLRRRVGARYRELFEPAVRQAHPPGSVDWVFPVLTRPEARARVAAILERDDRIETRPAFPPLGVHPHVRAAGRVHPTPVADRIGASGLLLPLHAAMSEDDAELVAAAFVRAHAAASRGARAAQEEPR